RVASSSFVSAHFLVALLLCVVALPQEGWAQRKSPRRDLQNRWEFMPDIGADFTPQIDSDERPTLEVSAIRAPDLQTRIYAMQRVVQDSAREPENREELFAAVVEQLQSDVQTLDNRQAILATTSAARTLANSKAEIEQVYNLVKSKSFAAKAIELDLVRLESGLARDAWRERLKAKKANLGELLTAIDGIAITGDSSDRASLESLLMSESTLLPIQLATSKALGQCVSEGLESFADSLLDSNRPEASLLATNVLQTHSSPDALQLMEKVLLGNNAQAQVTAFKTIVRANFGRGKELAKQYIKHPDGNMRYAAVQVLNQDNDEESVNTQALALDDTNLNVRTKVRNNLIGKARVKELQPLIDGIITHYLGGEKWEGIEQAINLSVALKQNKRAPQLVELLDHPRPEIFVRAAWGLHMMRLQPETLDSIYAVAKQWADKIGRFEAIEFDREITIGFLFQALGVHRYEPASEMLLKFVPKDRRMRDMTRTAAIYALGLIWANQEKPALVQQLIGRIRDDGLDADLGTVRYVAAVSLGLVGNESNLGTLEYASYPEPDPIGKAARWAAGYIESKRK
ncbi:MAG: hypothetical protein AB8B50_10085, partial [Pirellulaceae bacterium]